MARRPLILNAVLMDCAGDIAHGLWSHPRDQSHRHNELDYWTGIARTLEAGGFDTLFLADVIGANDVYGGGPASALRHAVQVPIGDPMLLVSAMAAATRNLGFGVTVNTSYSHPALLARSFSTLDHLARGRVAWNIVTGFSDSAARAMGDAAQIPHDERYDRAEDFLAAAYKLWEGSWDEDALVIDKAARIFTRPEGVRAIAHNGPWHRVSGIHLQSPSPQRTPLLYQAGASARGQEFAARHAECVFISGSPAQAREIVRDIRARAARHGRGRDDLRILVGVLPVLGRTEAEARDRFEEYARHASPEGGLTHFSQQTGIDLAALDPDEPIVERRTEAAQSFLEAVTKRAQGRVWTVRQVRESMRLGCRNQPVVGTPVQVADALQAFVEEADVDGFNILRTVVPECFEDVAALLIPELRSRGLARAAPAEGPLRQRLFGHARLPANHPGAAFRHQSALQEA